MHSITPVLSTEDSIVNNYPHKSNAQYNTCAIYWRKHNSTVYDDKQSSSYIKKLSKST